MVIIFLNLKIIFIFVLLINLKTRNYGKLRQKQLVY